jgi:hypothetical protein
VCHHKDLDAFRHSDGLPSQFTLDHPILGRDVVWIIENQYCRFEANPVFSLICAVLSLIPSELQSAGPGLYDFVYTV